VKTNKQQLEQLHDLCRENIFDKAIVQPLAEELGVSIDSLLRLGIGCRPGDGDRTYTFPVRTGKGQLVGINRRFINGSKCFVTGSKHGLYYDPEANATTADNVGSYKGSFIRLTDAGVNCPICGRNDWCMVSEDNPNDPAAAICGVTEEGSVKHIENSGYLHILKESGDFSKTAVAGEAEGETGEVVLLTEGLSDTATGFDLGFETIGRTTALCGVKEIPAVLRGRKVRAIVIGDNDTDPKAKEVGQRGMKRVAEASIRVCTSVIMVLPPPEYKDFREWYVTAKLTKDQFMQWVKAHGVVEEGQDTLSSDIAFDIANAWLKQYHFEDGLPTLRVDKGQWMEYDENHYKLINIDSVRGELYRHLEGKNCIVNEAVVPYKTTRAKVTDITDALNGLCLTDQDAPCWLEDRGFPPVTEIIPFKNGILDVKKYIEGEVVLYDPTPALLSNHILPYDFDEDADSKLWRSYVNEIFNNDTMSVDLLAQWFGYNCVPDMSHEKMMLFTGRPRSGKGTVITALMSMLGREQCVSTSFQNLCSEFGYQPLVGKLSAILGDARVPKHSQSHKALEKLLQIIGGDPVGIRRMHRGELGSTYLTCRFTAAMNELPDIPDSANALGPRMNILEFPNSYVGKENRGLKAQLSKEASSGKLIKFALDGLRLLHQCGSFLEPENSKAQHRQMVELVQPMSAFLTDCCEMMPPGDSEEDYHVSKQELYDVWVGWCDEARVEPNKMTVFGRRVTQACPNVGTKQIQIEGRRHRMYRGIRVAKWAKQAYMGR
jgi:putative DNA primase/helicase